MSILCFFFRNPQMHPCVGRMQLLRNSRMRHTRFPNQLHSPKTPSSNVSAYIGKALIPKVDVEWAGAQTAISHPFPAMPDPLSNSRRFPR